MGLSVRISARISVRIAALLAVAAGCSASSPPPAAVAGRDGGDAAPASRASAAGAVAGAADAYRIGALADSGTLEVQVVWSTPPPELLRSAGTNACDLERPAAVPVAPVGVIADRYATERMISVSGAVVTLIDIGEGKAPPAAEPTQLALVHCRWEPRVVRLTRLGAALSIVNDDERRHDIEVAGVGNGSGVLAAAQLPVIGHRVEISLPEPGIVRVSSSAAPADPAYVVVPAHPYTEVSDARGRAVLAEVPPGSYTVRVWYPPLAVGAEPLVVDTKVTVAGAGARTNHRVELSQ